MEKCKQCEKDAIASYDGFPLCLDHIMEWLSNAYGRLNILDRHTVPDLEKRVAELEAQCGICGGPGPHEPDHPYCTKCAQGLTSPFMNLERLHLALGPLEQEIHEGAVSDANWKNVSDALRAIENS